MKIRLHAFEPASRANGPGLRAVVWFQGCTLGCPGCFNPGTHDPSGGYDSDTETLATEIEGISVSGGEPFQQPAALLDLLIRMSDSKLSRLVITGYTLSEIKRLPLGPSHVANCSSARMARSPYPGFFPGDGGSGRSQTEKDKTKAACYDSNVNP